MNNKLARISAAVYGRPWFIQQSQLDRIAELVRFHVEGGRLSRDEIAERLAEASDAAGPRTMAARPRLSSTLGSVAVIPIYGTIFPRANLMTDYSGGATISGIRQAFREALADDTVGSILFDIDSPGGYTDGVEELATEIREARGQKPMVSIADYTMASAAAYLGCQADEVVASPSSMVGWIGTVMVLQEFSKMDEMMGVTTNILRDPPGKYGGNEFEPLSDQARTELQQIVDDASAQFHSAMAKGRGITVAQVRADFGQGGGMSAARAKAAGLVDRVDTFDATVRRLATGKGPVSRGTSAIAEGVPYRVAAIEGGDATPGDDPDAAATGEPGTPPSDIDPEPAPDRSTEAEAALALARARAR